MVQLPTFERGADNGDIARALGDLAKADGRHLYHQLRVGTVAGNAVAARALAVSDLYCRRVFEAQRVPIEQGYRAFLGLGGYSALHWSLVESDGDSCPQFLIRFG